MCAMTDKDLSILVQVAFKSAVEIAIAERGDAPVDPNRIATLTWDLSKVLHGTIKKVTARDAKTH